MASPLVGKAPACLACLRRITTTSSSAFGALSQQVRGKTRKATNKHKGSVIVRLLEDVPSYGERGRILRTPAQLMRTRFFPNQEAEYMTREVMRAEGLTKNDVGDRDRAFGMERRHQEEIFLDDAVEDVAYKSGEYRAFEQGEGGLGLPGPEEPKHGVEIEQLAPERALELMSTIVPNTLTFERYPQNEVAAAEAAASKTEAALNAEARVQEDQEILSPMAVWRAKMLADAEKKRKEAEDASKTSEELEAERLAAEREAEEKRLAAEREAEEKLKIFGSVSLRDIASAIRETMLLDPEAARISVVPENIKFIDLAEGTDKVEKLGFFNVEIAATVGKLKVPPVLKQIEVVPQS